MVTFVKNIHIPYVSAWKVEKRFSIKTKILTRTWSKPIKIEVVLANVDITLQVIARFWATISSLELKIAIKLMLAEIQFSIKPVSLNIKLTYR